MFDFGNFIELFLASFMILLLCASLNMRELFFTNLLESIQSISALILFGLLATTPILVVVFIMKNFKKISNEKDHKLFHQKYGKVFDNMRTESRSALLFLPISMGLKVIYVLDIIMFEDGPFIQFFIAIAAQVVGILFQIWLSPTIPHERKTGVILFVHDGLADDLLHDLHLGFVLGRNQSQRSGLLHLHVHRHDGHYHSPTDRRNSRFLHSKMQTEKKNEAQS